MTNLTAQHAEMEYALLETSETWEKMFEKVTKTCALNRATYKESSNFTKLDLGSEKFFKVSERVMKDASGLLKISMYRILNDKSSVYELIDQITSGTTSVYFAIHYLEKNLRIVGYEALANSDSEISREEQIMSAGCSIEMMNRCWWSNDAYKEADKSKESSMAKKEKVKKFIRLAEEYISWLKETVDELGNAVHAHVDVIKNLIVSAEIDKILIERVDDLLSDRLKKQSKDEVVFHYFQVHLALQEIIDKCSHFV